MLHVREPRIRACVLGTQLRYCLLAMCVHAQPCCCFNHAVQKAAAVLFGLGQRHLRVLQAGLEQLGCRSPQVLGSAGGCALIMSLDCSKFCIMLLSDSVAVQVPVII